MNDSASSGGFGLFGADHDIGVRFPPGLGIIPPRELSRVPRPRRDGELVA